MREMSDKDFLINLISAVTIAVTVACLISAGLCISVSIHIATISAKVEQQKSNVAAAYQERMDFIPNLASAVKAAAEHESDTLKDVTEAGIRFSDAVKSGSIEDAQETDEELTKSIAAMVEAYPEITATQNFVSLQDQLEGSENRIREARNKYSDAVKDYNSYIKKPIISEIVYRCGFKIKNIDYFTADPGAEVVPTASCCCECTCARTNA